MTPSAAPEAPIPPRTERRLRLGRELALIALLELGLKKGFGLRAARVYSFGVFITYALVLWLTRGRDHHGAIQSILHAALVSLSWVVGALAALGTTQALAQQTERDAFSALARQHGFDQNAMARARLIATALRITCLVALPALLLIAVALARRESVSWALVTAPAVLIYAALLGSFLALLAHFSAALAPRHPRALLAALVLAPLLLSQLFPGIPSISAAFGSLLDRLLGAGAAAT